MPDAERDDELSSSAAALLRENTEPTVPSVERPPILSALPAGVASVIPARALAGLAEGSALAEALQNAAIRAADESSSPSCRKLAFDYLELAAKYHELEERLAGLEDWNEALLVESRSNLLRVLERIDALIDQAEEERGE